MITKIVKLAVLVFGMSEMQAVAGEQVVIRDGREYILRDGQEIPLTRDPFDLNRDGRVTRAERKEVRRKAEQGDAESQFKIGRFGSDYDRKEMQKWLLLAAEQGHPQAACELGSLYEPHRSINSRFLSDGGVSTDISKSVYWYRRAVEMGVHEAKGYLARAQFNNGDYDAIRGGASEQYQLAHKYWRDGDLESAAKWMRQAAENGSVDAQFFLSTMYLRGQGVPESDSEAVKWARLAADQGDAQSQTNLGWLYATGRGVQKDEQEALEWYRKAASQGDRKAEELLAELGKDLADRTPASTEKVDPMHSVNDKEVSAAGSNRTGEQRGFIENDASKWIYYLNCASYAFRQSEIINAGVMEAEGRLARMSPAEATGLVRQLKSEQLPIAAQWDERSTLYVDLAMLFQDPNSFEEAGIEGGRKGAAMRIFSSNLASRGYDTNAQIASNLQNCESKLMQELERLPK